jgi:primosomal protein N''
MRRFFSTVAPQAAKQIEKNARTLEIDKQFEARYEKMIQQAKLKIEQNLEYKELAKKTDSKKLDNVLEEINNNLKTFSAY